MTDESRHQSADRDAPLSSFSPPPPLSDSGQTRRDAIFAVLETAMRRRRHRRIALRTAIATAPVIAVAALLFRLLPPSSSPTVAPTPLDLKALATAPVNTTRPPSARYPTMTAAAFEWIPAAAEPPELNPRRAKITMLDDDGLQDTLAEAGLPTGIMRTGSRVILASQIVPTEDKHPTDPENPPAPQG